MSTAIDGHANVSKGLKKLLQSPNAEHAKMAKKLKDGYDKLWKDWKSLRDSRPFPKDLRAEEEQTFGLGSM